MNGWSASRFHELFARYRPYLKRIRFVERKAAHGLSLIREYPECFRGKVGTFDDLTAELCEILFQVK
jgi:hypothetical protein